ncbi:hypothetical protein V6N13_130694 [Hibiscus sabdariffa]
MYLYSDRQTVNPGLEQCPVKPVEQSIALDKSFGPWVMVERHPRRTKKLQSDSDTNTAFQIQGSHFNPILASDLGEELNVPIGSNLPPLPSSNPSHKQPKNRHSRLQIRKNWLRQTKHLRLLFSQTAPCQSLGFPGVIKENVDPNVVQLSNVVNGNMELVDVSIGCGDPRFLPATKKFLRYNKPNVVVFVEPRISGKRADSVISSLGFPYSHRVEATGFAGGIWLAWYDTISVTVDITHFQFMHFRITNNKTRSSFYATAVYASPTVSGRKFLWPHLERLGSTIRGPWIMFGDFNATLGPADRKGCVVSSTPNKTFQNLLFDDGLRDMGFTGPAFTWSRGRAFARLDHFICNNYFDEAYPTASVHHLMRMRSDHHPILLQIGNVSSSPRVSPFLYLSGWLTHDDFPRMVADNWSPTCPRLFSLLLLQQILGTKRF